MSIKYYVSDRIVCGSGDTKPLDMEDGAHLIETGANLVREYVKVNGAWQKIFPVSGSVKVVNTLTDLKALAVNDYTSAYIKGYHTANDGGGGMFNLTTVTEGTNSGALISSNTFGYSWERVKNSREWYVEEWGARGDGSTNDAPAIQNLVDYLITGNGGKAKFRTAKSYALQSPIIIARKSTDGLSYQQVLGITFEADNLSPILSHTTELFQTNPVYPCVIIQQGRHIEFKGITFRGLNTFLAEGKLDSIHKMIDGDNYLCSGNAVATGRYNPHAGLLTDVFSNDSLLTGINSGNQYSGLSGYYVGSQGGTANVILRNCVFSNLVVGFLQNPNPASNVQQGDGISLYDCQFRYSKEGLVSCQSQSRAVNLFNCGFAFCDTLISTKKYGRQGGTPPIVFGGQMGWCRRLFDIEPSFGDFKVYGLYAENVGSLGIVGSHQDGNSAPCLFNGCYFSFPAFTGRRMEYMGYLGAPTLFQNCLFNSNASGVLNFANGVETTAISPVQFQNCKFISNGRTFADTTLALTSYRNTKFENCSVFDSTCFSNGAQLRDLDISLAPDDYNRNFVPFGGRLVIGDNFYTTDFTPQDIEAGISNVTFNTGAGTATGSVAAVQHAALLRTGDGIVNRQSFNIFETDGNGVVFNVVGQYVGTIDMISGTSISLRDVPKCWNNTHSLTSNTVRRLRRFHEPTTGDITTSSTLIKNVNPVSAWKTGDAIRHSAFPAGTHIVSITGNVITASRAAVASITSGIIYDARYLKVSNELNTYPLSNPSGFTSAAGFSGTFVSQTQYNLTGANGSGTLDWNNQYLVNNGVNVVDWGNNFLTDNDGFGAGNWDSRILTNSSENTTLDWQNQILTGNWNATTLRISGSYVATSGYVFNNFVDRSNNQIITGNKTFISNIGIGGNFVPQFKLHITGVGTDNYAFFGPASNLSGFRFTTQLGTGRMIMFGGTNTAALQLETVNTNLIKLNASNSNVELNVGTFNTTNSWEFQGDRLVKYQRDIVGNTGRYPLFEQRASWVGDGIAENTTGRLEFYTYNNTVGQLAYRIDSDIVSPTKYFFGDTHLLSGNVHISGNVLVSGKNPFVLKTRHLLTTYTPDWNDDILLCSTFSGTYAVKLPAASTLSGKLLRFKRTSTGINSVVISGNWIDGETGISLVNRFDSLTVASDGSGYYTF